jgi:hypothetical protein
MILLPFSSSCFVAATKEGPFNAMILLPFSISVFAAVAKSRPPFSISGFAAAAKEGAFNAMILLPSSICVFVTVTKSRPPFSICVFRSGCETWNLKIATRSRKNYRYPINASGSNLGRRRSRGCCTAAASSPKVRNWGRASGSSGGLCFSRQRRCRSAPVKTCSGSRRRRPHARTSSRKIKRHAVTRAI